MPILNWHGISAENNEIVAMQRNHQAPATSEYTYSKRIWHLFRKIANRYNRNVKCIQQRPAIREHAEQNKTPENNRKEVTYCHCFSSDLWMAVYVESTFDIRFTFGPGCRKL